MTLNEFCVIYRPFEYISNHIVHMQPINYTITTLLIPRYVKSMALNEYCVIYRPCDYISNYIVHMQPINYAITNLHIPRSVILKIFENKNDVCTT